MLSLFVNRLITVAFFYRAMLCQARLCYGKSHQVDRPSVCMWLWSTPIIWLFSN